MNLEASGTAHGQRSMWRQRPQERLALRLERLPIGSCTRQQKRPSNFRTPRIWPARASQSVHTNGFNGHVVSKGASARLVAQHYGNSMAASASGSSMASMGSMHEPGLKIIGLGVRGASSVNKLRNQGHVKEAEFWVIDSDKKSLSSCEPDVHTLEVPISDDGALSPEDLEDITGPVPPVTAETKDGGAGVVFVLGSTLGSPGGAPLMLQLVNHLRRMGFFVACALTRPFGFEGPRKLEQAAALLEVMEEVAHLVVVVDQGVLTRSHTGLTIPQASGIAENTLQHTVRAVLWALRAPEVLKVAHGSYLWHGRDLRSFKRPLSPPMMSLLTCPGHAHLGRGQAAIPASSLQQAGLPSTLSTLSEDAVRAAAGSPFLEGRMAQATAVLCVLRLPQAMPGRGISSSQGGVQAAVGAVAGGGVRGAWGGSSGGSGSGPSGGTYSDTYWEYALRSAVQVAAMTVHEISGSRCRDIIVCPQLRDAEEEEALRRAAAADGDADGAAVNDPSLLLECSLLVLEEIEEAAGKPEPDASSAGGAAAGAAAGVPETSGASAWGSALGNDGSAATLSSPAARLGLSRGAGGRGRDGAGADSTSSAGAAAAAVGPSSFSRANWSAMSMLAGGSAMAAHNMHGGQRAGGTAAGASGGSGSSWDEGDDERSGASSGRQAAGGGITRRGRPQQQPLGTAAGSDAGPVRAVNRFSASLQQQAPSQQQQQQQQEIPRMSSSLVSSMVAQSLDLPPGAARWRHQQTGGSERGAAVHHRVYHLPQVGMADDESDEEEEEEGGDGRAEDHKRAPRNPLASLLLGVGGGAGGGSGRGRGARQQDQASVKSRVAGMLDRERD